MTVTVLVPMEHWAPLILMQRLSYQYVDLFALTAMIDLMLIKNMSVSCTRPAEASVPLVDGVSGNI
jgi:hypothetical protein